MVYLEPSQTSKIELSAKIFNSLKPVTIFSKSSILDVWLSFEYASAKIHAKLAAIMEGSYYEVNPIRLGLCQINARLLKMTTILERFSTLVPFIMTFNFHGLCRYAHIVPGPFPQIRIQDIGFAAITAWIPTFYFINSFVDTNKCAIVYSFCQYYNLNMVS